MKGFLKALLILLIVCGLVAGGVYGYSRYTMSQPVPVQPAGNWLLEYSPNQTYLGGSVVSGDSLVLYGAQDKTPLEVYVTAGQAVHVGDPLIRYDTTKDSIDLDEKLLARQKLYDSLTALYKEYGIYAYTPYPRTIPTATPKPSPTPQGYTGLSARRSDGLGVVRLSSLTRQNLARIDQNGNEAGSKEKPFLYRFDPADPIPESLLLYLQSQVHGQSVHVWFESDLGYLYLVFQPLEAEADTLNFSLAAMEQPNAPTGQANWNTMQPMEGEGSLKAPWVFDYTEGQEVTGVFSTRYAQQARAGRYIYTELKGQKLTVALDFTSMGACILRLKSTPQPTATPTPTPTPSPTPTATPEASPTEDPEGWIDEPVYINPQYPPLARPERLAHVAELEEQIRDGELQYRQLCHDIDILLTATGQNGKVLSTIDGVVTSLDAQARSGEVLLEVRGGSGKGVISCMLGETELSKYPVGTELTGFSYDIGDSVTAVVTYLSPMPVTDSYSNGGNPNSSGYTMLLEVQGDVELPLYSYVEFTSYEPLSKSGAIYLYEAFVREMDGQDCIFVARDGVLKKVPVHTGRRVMEYIELIGSDLTREDYIAFPYGKNIRDGAPTEITDTIW